MTAEAWKSLLSSNPVARQYFHKKNRRFHLLAARLRGKVLKRQTSIRENGPGGKSLCFTEGRGNTAIKYVGRVALYVSNPRSFFQADRARKRVHHSSSWKIEQSCDTWEIHALPAPCAVAHKCNAFLHAI